MEEPGDDVFEQIKKRLSDGVYEQIKNFEFKDLTEEQESLVNKLILDEKLKEYYERCGLCEKCKQPKNNHDWCRICNFQQNFKNWTSGNHDVDKFIQKTQLKAESRYTLLEWIEYDRVEGIERLAEGGFGITYKAIWKDGLIRNWDSENNRWNREKTYKNHPNYPVALKCLYNSQDITTEFLKEIESHIISVNSAQCIIQCYGITKDPKTNNFMMVMEYAKLGNLRQHLNDNFNSLNWSDKVFNLFTIVVGLKSIHEKGLIHRDFHCGNILSNSDSDGSLYSSITDLGLCKPANEKSDKNIYGVLPYVAPEVLKGKRYTQASDVYGFGIIAYEVCTGLPPYHDVAHDGFLAIKICKGLRPSSNYKIPQLILDIIQKCWDPDPLKRLNAKELKELFADLQYNEQIREADRNNEQLPLLATPSTDILSYTTHPQAIYTSRLLDFKCHLEPSNTNNNDDSFEIGHSGSINIDFCVQYEGN